MPYRYVSTPSGKADCAEKVADLERLIKDILDPPNASLGSDKSSTDSRFNTADLSKEFQGGTIETAQRGLKTFMGVNENRTLKRDVESMQEEFEAFKRECTDPNERTWWRKPKIAEEVLECMYYCKDHEAGSSPLKFSNSEFPRDCDANGVRSDRKIKDESRPEGYRGMQLNDFVQLPEARRAHLSIAEVFALRVYTTRAYIVLNQPFTELRQNTSRSGRESWTAEHPFPNTVMCIYEALKKLRAESKMDTLWRGVSNVTVESTFLQGGTMLGPTSTSLDPEVAINYLQTTKDNSQALLLKLNLGTGLDGGGMIRFLSAFPAEQEVLFPPLTYLERVGQTDEVKLKRGRRVKIVEVKPTLA